MSDWENVVISETEEDRNAYYWSGSDCPTSGSFSSDCTIVQSISGRKRGDNGGSSYEIESTETFELLTAFTKVPNAAVDRSCYTTPYVNFESAPLSVEFEVRHNPLSHSGDYQFGDHLPEESNTSDDDTGLLQKSIGLVGSFVGKSNLLGKAISILSFIDWSSSSPVVVEREDNDNISDHYIYWDLDHAGSDEHSFPTTDEPTGVQFAIKADPAGASYGYVDTWSRYTVSVLTYSDDQCPCTNDNAIPVVTTVTPVSHYFSFENTAAD